MFVLKCDRCKKEVSTKCPNNFATEIQTVLKTYLGGAEFSYNSNAHVENYTLCTNCGDKLKQFLNNEPIED